MKVKKISAANVEACSLPKLFDEEKIDFQPVQCVNWAEYPYKPKVNFRIAHTQNSINQRAVFQQRLHKYWRTCFKASGLSYTSITQIQC